MGRLAEIAEEYGLHTLGVLTTAGRLQKRSGPFACIARLDGGHFVLIADVKDGQARIVDPPRDYSIPLETLESRWDGTALLLSPSQLVAEENLPKDYPFLAALAASAIAAGTAAAFCCGRRIRRQRLSAKGA
jgi:ABC-type bacteriocin/lantibiotic exporter with double-glycine peptidase domain